MYGIKCVTDILNLFLLPGDQNPSFETAVKYYRQSEDVEYKLHNIIQYTEEEAKAYELVFGDDLANFKSDLEEQIAYRTSLFTRTSRIQTIKAEHLSFINSFTFSASDYPTIFKEAIAESKKVKESICFDNKVPYAIFTHDTITSGGTSPVPTSVFVDQPLPSPSASRPTRLLKKSRMDKKKHFAQTIEFLNLIQT